ncbi:MAG TPA: hypothetical protein VFG78_10485, partial [Gemmatimonadota bacterium]|nr:hypothetical protein [Gemmatimonadota bacterium]
MPEKDGQARRLAGDPLAGLDADRLKRLLGEAWQRPPAPTPEERSAGLKGRKLSEGGPTGEAELPPSEDFAGLDRTLDEGPPEEGPPEEVVAPVAALPADEAPPR